MREYKKGEICIDGRNIPYTVFTAADYLIHHDGLTEEAMYEFMNGHYGLYQKINQIIAIKQSCYLLRRVDYSCGSLSDDLYSLKMELILKIKNEYGYIFDDDWMESLVDSSK